MQLRQAGGPSVPRSPPNRKPLIARHRRERKEVLECDLKAEYSARELYREAHDACRDLGDIGSMELFKELLQDEEGHIDFLETELGLLERIGLQNYGQLQAEPAGGKA